MGATRFAVLQLSGCAGCEVSLLDADEWLNELELVYLPLVVSARELPPVDLLLVTGAVRTERDLYELRQAARGAKRIVAVGTCAISGGVVHLGDREELREIFMAEAERCHVPHLLPKSRPIDSVAAVDRYLPGCPPTPQLFTALLRDDPTFRVPATVCAECGRRKLKDRKPSHLQRGVGGEVEPGVCLINQGYLCIGTSTRGGCGALCTRPGHICVGCRGPSDAFVEKESAAWLNAIQRVFAKMTAVPSEEIAEALRAPQLALFLFQFADYDGQRRTPRPREKVL